MNDNFLAGRTALVTGSTSGIGLAIASALAAAGAKVAINGLGSAEQIGSAIADVNAAGHAETRHFGADLRDPAAIESMMSELTAWSGGGVDILVNNAGIQHAVPLAEMPVQKWNDIIAINLSAAFHTMRVALPGMAARGYGRVINIASVHGLVGSVNKAAYVAAKHGLLGLTKVTALETARTGVTCNALCPGWVLTPLVQRQVDDRAAREGLPDDEARQGLLLEKQPSGDFVGPEQIAATAMFLCSDAASQVRGAAWNLDGGWTAQ